MPRALDLTCGSAPVTFRSTTLPLASISLDADDLWSYMKTHGDAGWEARPSYLPKFIPAALEAFDRVGIRVTFFIVGIDAARPECAEVLGSIPARGHEVGNHSYEHEPWLHLYTPSALRADVERAEEAIIQATGQRPVGFRGPGYSWSPALLELLAERGYLFDASTLPTYVGPLARAYYFRSALLTDTDRKARAELFGTLRDGRRPVRPYMWRMPNGRSLLEIPVTTVPGIKIPFHLSYLLYLSKYSERGALAYLRAALAACAAAQIAPSFLLHPLDLLGSDRVPQLRFFPGMELSSARKEAFFERVVGILQERFTLVPMGSHARSLLLAGALDERRAAPPSSALTPAT